MGRFVSNDNPLIAVLLLSEIPNSYLYVLNNPVNYIDPSGHAGISPPIGPGPINQAQIQARIDGLRSQIRELEAKLKDPCLSAAAKGSIKKWLRYLRLLLEFLLRLYNQEPPPPPPGGQKDNEQQQEWYTPNAPNAFDGIVKM